MWELIQVSVGPAMHRGRYRVEGSRIVLEWRGGRTATSCGHLRPEIVAEARLRQLVSSERLAA